MRPTTDKLAAVELVVTENPPYSHLGFISPAAPDPWLAIPREPLLSHLLHAKFDYKRIHTGPYMILFLKYLYR
jgi:hypothetical protein